MVSSSDGSCPLGVARHVASTIAQKSSGITRLTSLPNPRTVSGSDTASFAAGSCAISCTAKASAEGASSMVVTRCDGRAMFSRGWKSHSSSADPGSLRMATVRLGAPVSTFSVTPVPPEADGWEGAG